MTKQITKKNIKSMYGAFIGTSVLSSPKEITENLEHIWAVK